MIIRAPYPDAGGGGGMRLWTPNDLAVKPAFWFDAQDSATITQSAGKVSAWANKGTRGGSLTQATPASQPSYSATANGGKPTILFNGSQSMAMAYVYTGAAILFAAISQLETTAAGSGRLAALVSSAPDDFASAAAMALLARGGSTSQVRADSNNASSPMLATSYTTPFLSVSQRTTTTLSASLNGGTAGTTSVSSTAFNSTSLLVGTGRFSGSNNLFWGGFSPEMVGLEYTPTLSELQDLEGYLAWNNGRQDVLVAGHPRKAAPRMVAA